MRFAVPVGLMWVGYTAMWWGWYRIGGPVDLLDLIVPGRVLPPRGPKAFSSDPNASVGGPV